MSKILTYPIIPEVESLSGLMTNRILTAIENLYLNSKQMQEGLLTASGNIRDMGINVARDFCTIHIKSPRQTGNTTAIMHFLLRHRLESWLVLFPSTQNIRVPLNLSHEINEMTSFNQNIGVMRSVNNTATNHTIFMGFDSQSDTNTRGLSLDGIIVDCTSGFRKKEIDLMYERYILNMNRRYMFFIFIG